MTPYKVQVYNSIHPSGLALFGDDYRIGDFDDPDAILLRSHQLMKKQIPKAVRIIARAGSGTNNIPVSQLPDVVVENTPGGNSTAVAELVATAWRSILRNTRDAMRFVRDLDPAEPDYRSKADAGKKRYVGNELAGKRLGVIGMGAIGRRVATIGLNDGFEVWGYDPHIGVDGAWMVDPRVRHVRDLNTLLKNCDLVSLHLPLEDDTRGKIGAEELAAMKAGAILLNYAREELVQTEPLLEALNEDLQHYATDFPMPELHRHPKVSATPHLGASTEEAEEICAVRAVRGIIAFLEYGTIFDSVNYPQIELEHETPFRLVVLHRNIPGMTGQIGSVVGESGANIKAHRDEVKADNACSIMALEEFPAGELLKDLRSINGVYRAYSL